MKVATRFDDYVTKTSQLNALDLIQLICEV